MEKISFVAACKRYFGLKQDQKLLEFQGEIKALTPQDRADLTPLLAAALGVVIES